MNPPGLSCQRIGQEPKLGRADFHVRPGMGLRWNSALASSAHFRGICLRAILVLVVLMVFHAVESVLSQPFRPRDISPDFSAVNRATGQPVHLSDFEGRVIVLIWLTRSCSVCAFKVSEMETEVQRFYGRFGFSCDVLSAVRNRRRIQSQGERHCLDVWEFLFALSG